jgi:hypothetical protein
MASNSAQPPSVDAEKEEAKYVKSCLVGKSDRYLKHLPHRFFRGFALFSQRASSMGGIVSWRASRWLDHDKHAERISNSFQGMSHLQRILPISR